MEQINPIIKADFPDPDVIRVEDTYYMICTTMHFFPGGIILRSYDLIHWEFASYVFDRLESTDAQRLQGEQSIYGKGMWAASLRYHKNKFYVCFSAYDVGKTYLFSADEKPDHGKNIMWKVCIIIILFCLMMTEELILYGEWIGFI